MSIPCYSTNDWFLICIPALLPLLIPFWKSTNGFTVNNLIGLAIVKFTWQTKKPFNRRKPHAFQQLRNSCPPIEWGRGVERVSSSEQIWASPGVPLVVAGVGASGQKRLNRSGVPPSRGGEFHETHHMGTLPPYPKQTFPQTTCASGIGFVIILFSASVEKLPKHWKVVLYVMRICTGRIWMVTGFW